MWTRHNRIGLEWAVQAYGPRTVQRPLRVEFYWRLPLASSTREITCDLTELGMFFFSHSNKTSGRRLLARAPFPFPSWLSGSCHDSHHDICNPNRREDGSATLTLVPLSVYRGNHVAMPCWKGLQEGNFLGAQFQELRKVIQKGLGEGIWVSPPTVKSHSLHFPLKSKYFRHDAEDSKRQRIFCNEDQ